MTNIVSDAQNSTSTHTHMRTHTSILTVPIEQSVPNQIITTRDTNKIKKSINLTHYR